jgi:hypothetical protein
VDGVAATAGEKRVSACLPRRAARSDPIDACLPAVSQKLERGVLSIKRGPAQ